MNKNQEEIWEIHTEVEDNSFELHMESMEEKDNFFLETDIGEDTEDFFQEFNKPSQIEKKKTKQERLHEYKKINTKLPPLLHRMLKTYCSQKDLKKNDVFKEALTIFMKKNKKDSFDLLNEVNGTTVEVGMESTNKKAYNFEVDKDFFREIKTYASTRDLKMIVFYEQAIIKYLNEKKFTF